MDREALERTFVLLADLWRRDTMNLSSVGQMMDHPAYECLLAIGPPVLPLVMLRLEREPDPRWFPLLRDLTGDNPVPKEHAGYVERMAEDWIAWHREHPVATLEDSQ